MEILGTVDMSLISLLNAWYRFILYVDFMMLVMFSIIVTICTFSSLQYFYVFPKRENI